MPNLVNNVLDWMGEHPVLTVVLFVLLLTGGITISFTLGFDTKLMPY